MKKKIIYMPPSTEVVDVETEGHLLANTWSTDNGASSEGYIINGLPSEEDDQWVRPDFNNSEESESKGYNVWDSARRESGKRIKENKKGKRI